MLPVVAIATEVVFEKEFYLPQTVHGMYGRYRTLTRQ